MIQLKNISKDYVSSMGVVTNCLENISFTINKGDICALCGASGSGKTTILNIISLLDKPTLGEVLIDNEDITSQKINLDDFRLDNIGIVFQSFNLIEILTVSENIKIPAEFSNKKFDTTLFNDIVNDLGLSELLNKFPSELSGGQQQRVAIARSLINKPKILLADEPTGNLDSENADKVIKMLVGIAKKYGMSLLIVTHDQAIADKCDRTILVKDGKIYE